VTINRLRGEVMDKITTVGLDLAKQVMAVHAVGADGQRVMRKVLRRDQLLRWSATLPRCVVAMEACGGAHYWARELTRQGHTVRIIAAEFVQAFRKSGKNDANDAEAICTAVRQANMRFVAMKSVEQQAALCVHRLRQGLVEERTALINRLRGLLTEFGVVAPLSPEKLRRELACCQDPEDRRLPPTVGQLVGDQLMALDQLEQRLAAYAEQIAAQAAQSDVAQRLQTIAGVGPTTAAALVATVGQPQEFRNGRQFAAWLGLVPKQHSSGGKTRLGRITKRGDAYLRTLLILGAKSALQAALRKAPEGRHRLQRWIVAVCSRIGYHKTLVAIANKHARIIWALLVRGEAFDPRRLAPATEVAAT
jgi:transposase